MVKGIEHVAIATRDPKTLAAWYIERLNFSFVAQIGPTTYIRDPRGAVLEFVPAETQPKPPEIRDAGLRHIAFEVDDFDDTIRSLSNAGINFSGEPFVFEGSRLQFFRDPEGNFLHLVKRERPLPG